MSSEQEKTNGKKLKLKDYLLDLETKGNIPHSSIEALKSVAVSGLGAYAGACFGRPSLLAGLGVTFVGYYSDIPKLTQLGVGMMSTGGFQLNQKTVNGTGTQGLEAIKERAGEVTASLKHSLYLDKIFKDKGKKKDQGTNGLGEGAPQYFKYNPNQLNSGSLEDIEAAISRSGEQYAAKQFGGNNDDFTGIEERLY